MRTWIRRGRRLVGDRGASAVEYGLMIAAIAAVIVAVVFGLGGIISGVFTHTCTSIGNTAQVQQATECTNDAP